jgi:hypothetical protein
MKEISKIVPVVVVFLLPGGTILIPFLAEVLDRRKEPRKPSPSAAEGNLP